MPCLQGGSCIVSRFTMPRLMVLEALLVRLSTTLNCLDTALVPHMLANDTSRCSHS